MCVPVVGDVKYVFVKYVTVTDLKMGKHYGKYIVLNKLLCNIILYFN